jgi:hypothetical protein
VTIGGDVVVGVHLLRTADERESDDLGMLGQALEREPHDRRIVLAVDESDDPRPGDPDPAAVGRVHHSCSPSSYSKDGLHTQLVRLTFR